MINVEGAAFYYKPKKYLFKDLSFELKPDETLAILGANGAGKTTLLRCLMGFLKFRQGKASINGRTIDSINPAEFWRMVSYVPQAQVPVFGYSSLNMVVMGRSSYIALGRQPKKEDMEAAMETMCFLGLEKIAEQPVSSLSGGQLQMVLIARALVKNPALLIMDEPETNLDLRNQLKVLEMIEKLKSARNISIVINTHFPCHAMRIAESSLLLGAEGYVFGKTREVIDEKSIREFYGVESVILNVEGPVNRVSALVPTGISKQIYLARSDMYEEAI
jgi:iron complex transport system ATP-binding protein